MILKAGGPCRLEADSGQGLVPAFSQPSSLVAPDSAMFHYSHGCTSDSDKDGHNAQQSRPAFFRPSYLRSR
jgi:hypothetical protein